MRTDRVCRSLILAALTLGANSGCASMAARWNAYLECKAEKHVARNEFRQSELEALKQELELERAAIRAQREADLAALKAEREHELACLQADAEKQNCQLRSQYDESVRTKLGMDLDQRVKIGQMQVNMDQLKQLVAERERDYNERMEIYKALKDQEKKAQLDNYRAMNSGAPTCSCSHPVCAAPDPNCEAPRAAGCCQTCGLPTRPAMAGDCAGTRPFREAPTRPLQEPLMATELPLMLPVRLELGVTNSYVNSSQVRRLPTQTRPQKTPCGLCEPCQCGKPCIRCGPPSCDVPGSNMPPAPTPAVPASDVVRRRQAFLEEDDAVPAGYQRLSNDRLIPDASDRESDKDYEP